jgi:hypothetical protein
VQDAVAAAARLALLGALSAASLPAPAFEFGDPRVRSSLGEPLDVRVPLQGTRGVAPDALCLSVGDANVPGVPPVTGAIITVEGPDTAPYARIRTRTAMQEPAASMQLRSGCGGASAADARNYTVLLDLKPARPAQPPKEAAAPKATDGSSASVLQPGMGYLLKISPEPLDLRRSAGIDAAGRAALRERLRGLQVGNGPAERPPRPDATAAAPMTAPRPVAARSAVPPAAQPSHAASFSLGEWAPWGLAGGAFVLLAGLAWRRLRTQPHVDEASPGTQEAPAPAHAPEVEEPIEIAVQPLAGMATDASLATRLPENHAELRRRYIQERFPEIERGAIVLDEPATVVKGARLFYEDGAVSRAIELLHFAIEHEPSMAKPWLALFEILRLERRPAEYAALAGRFRQLHGDTEHWPKVRHFGHEIDPGNALFAAAPIDTLETIGPRAKRAASGARADGFDPIAENWLDAPMDFENEVLANDLRKALMASAGLTETHLEPDPMPALRRVEMFTVA